MKKIVLFIILFGLIFSLIWAAPTINGNLSEGDYTTIANGNGLGTWGLNVDKIVYYPDVANSMLYIGIEGNLDTGSSNGIGLWLGFSEYDGGKSAGTSLGGTSGAGHYMGDTGNNDYKADFAVDYMFAMNPGGGATSVYLDVVKFATGSGTGDYLGACDQSGTSITGPDVAGVFGANQVTFAFNNDNAANHGFEMSIPFSELGVTPAGLMKAFAFVVSSSAWFCQDCAPGSPPSGDPGFNADYNTLGGGPYCCDWKTLPVELSSFTASYVNEFVTICWQTASETDVIGFNIYRSEEDDFSTASDPINECLIEGQGTTTIMNDYYFTDETADPYYTTYYYWLEVINLGGSRDVYGSIIYEPGDIDNNGEINFVSTQFDNCYPNPAILGNTIHFGFRVGGIELTNRHIELKVYNVLGKLVKEIVNEDRLVDDYTEQWTPKNLPNGVYFYQLRTDNYNEVKKMLLVK